jgi:hypothetical protein
VALSLDLSGCVAGDGSSKDAPESFFPPRVLELALSGRQDHARPLVRRPFADTPDVNQTTFYFDPFARWAIRAFTAFSGFLGVLLLFAHVPGYSTLSGHTTSIVLLRTGSGAIAVLSIFGWRIGGKLGVHANAEGIDVRAGFGYRRRSVPWSEIATFRAVPSIVPVVCAQLRSGALIKTALVQGRRMRWQNGASRDIVGILSADLAREERTP